MMLAFLLQIEESASLCQLGYLCMQTATSGPHEKQRPLATVVQSGWHKAAAEIMEIVMTNASAKFC